MRYLSSLLFILVSLQLVAQIDHWESVVYPGIQANYLLPQSELPSNWTAVDYDDANWSTGTSGFGYGDNDDNTTIANTISVFTRTTFSITDLSAIDAALLHMDFDDGFVAYLNGVEIARAFVTGSPPAFDQPSNDFHEALLYQGIVPADFTVNVELLNEGENVLAIQVHNQDINSSDLSSLPVLSLGINNTSTNYQPVPEWFREPFDFVSSNLPIVILNTEGNQSIPDEPKIGATMTILHRGVGNRTFLSDEGNPEFTDYSGNIRIEVRGSSSQALPKKQYGFTTYDAPGINKENVSLLGMPNENDWILNGLAFDPSLMRDYISYKLSNRIGEYASRTQYCEMVLNGEYQGLYILQEKMKRDNDRIDVTPVSENTDGNITGGYVTKSDKETPNDPIAWTMPSFSWPTGFTHVEPKPEEVTQSQEDYIRGEFETLLNRSGANNTSFIVGYPSIIDVRSFIHFMIMNELGSNPDGYQFSTYYHKDKNGKLRAGPIWDFNLTYGNDLFEFGFDRSHTDVLQFQDGGNDGAIFWKYLYDSPQFRCHLAKRWNELTTNNGPLSYSSIEALIDETESLLSEASGREAATWGRIDNHTEDIINMKSWIATRLQWLTNTFGSFGNCLAPDIPPLVITKIHYHPLVSAAEESSDFEYIEITNTGNNEENLSGVYFGGTGFVYVFPANSTIAPNSSLILANNEQAYVSKYRTSPFGEFTRSLSNGGERLLLLDGFGNIIDEVTYDDSAPWPVEADGDGYLLELNDTNLDNNLGSNWTATEDVLPVTSIDPFDEQAEISIFPNPSSSQLIVRSASLIRQLDVYNIQGRRMRRIHDDSNEIQLDLSDYQNGTYIIKVTTSQGEQTRRILKIN